MEDKQVLQETREYIKLIQSDGENVPVDLDTNSYKMTIPVWYNEKLFKRAQKFYFDNLFAMSVGKLIGLLAVLSVPSILKILIHTRKSSCAATAYRRYIQTLLHTNCWYLYELKPGSKSWKSLEGVRKGHIVSSKYAEKGKAGFIMQRDMAYTQFGFIGYILLKPNLLGVRVCREDYEALVHFWRVIGYLLGMRDEFNLCTDSWRTTKPRLEILLNEIYKPYLENTSESFLTMATALIEGLWCINPILEINAILYYTKWVTGCKGYLYNDTDLRALTENTDDINNKLNALNWYSRWLLFVQITAHTFLVNYAIFRWYFNYQVWLSHIIIQWFPFLAFFKFGIKKAYVDFLTRDR